MGISPNSTRLDMKTVTYDETKWKLVPDASNMTDEQAEAIAERANCCGGIAYDIYRALLEVSPEPTK